MNLLNLFYKITVVILLMTQFVLAQDNSNDGENDELNIIQLELEKSQPQKKSSPEVKHEVNDAKESDFSTLGKLAPFTEISVLQKKYLPKTNRLIFTGGFSLGTNEPFFSPIGANLRAGYFFTESLGVELNYFSISTSERDITKDLRNIENIAAEGLLYTKNYFGGAFLWSPIYGKMAWFGKKIIPFDLYFSAGTGQTTVSTGEKPSTFHMGTGQIFALSKASAFRWDLSWNIYNAKNSDGSVSQFNNLYLTLAGSFFFPEAKYR